MTKSLWRFQVVSFVLEIVAKCLIGIGLTKAGWVLGLWGERSEGRLVVPKSAKPWQQQCSPCQPSFYFVDSYQHNLSISTCESVNLCHFVNIEFGILIQQHRIFWFSCRLNLFKPILRVSVLWISDQKIRPQLYLAIFIRMWLRLWFHLSSAVAALWSSDIFRRPQVWCQAVKNLHAQRVGGWCWYLPQYHNSAALGEKKARTAKWTCDVKIMKWFERHWSIDLQHLQFPLWSSIVRLSMLLLA